MGILTRDEILKAEDLKTERVSVPEWGGDVLVRTLTGIQWNKIQERMIDERQPDRKLNFDNLQARLVAYSIIDDKGKHLFDERDVKVLGQKSSAALNRVFDVAQRLSGVGPKDVEFFIKNS